MKFKIDQFYLDSNYGVIKFLGILDGNLLFDRYEKSFVKSGPLSGWSKVGGRVNIEPDFQQKRANAHKVRPIPPPQ